MNNNYGNKTSDKNNEPGMDWGRQGLFKQEGKGTSLRTMEAREDQETQVNYMRRVTRGAGERQNKISK